MRRFVSAWPHKLILCLTGGSHMWRASPACKWRMRGPWLARSCTGPPSSMSSLRSFAPAPKLAPPPRTPTTCVCCVFLLCVSLPTIEAQMATILTDGLVDVPELLEMLRSRAARCPLSVVIVALGPLDFTATKVTLVPPSLLPLFLITTRRGWRGGVVAGGIRQQQPGGPGRWSSRVAERWIFDLYPVAPRRRRKMACLSTLCCCLSSWTSG